MHLLFRITTNGKMVLATSTYTNTKAHEYAHAHERACTHARKHMNTHTHTHTHAHTHARKHEPLPACQHRGKTLACEYPLLLCQFFVQFLSTAKYEKNDEWSRRKIK